jgi:hypothetical protein
MGRGFGRFLRQNTIAMLALFIALGGTTLAAANALPKNSVGAKQLKKNAVTTPKIKKGAVTGSKIKLSSLGKVPSAANADQAAHATNADNATNATHAASATSATNATNATNATSATNSAQLGGVAAANYLQRTTVLWAVVDSSGIVRGSGATSSTNPGTGRYAVVFNRNVSQCDYIATPGSTSANDGSGSYPTQGETAVSPLAGNANGVVVTRATTDGTLQNFPVYVAVLC